MKPRTLFTSESVTEGHPDKVCDQISDAILDAMLEQDPRSRVAVETMVTRGLVHVVGEVTTDAYVEIPDIVRGVIRDIGYTSSEVGFDADSCGVSVSIGRQSPDIAIGVGRESIDDQGAGDQGMMFGYASDETDTLMPLPITAAHRIAERLAGTRRYLRPDILRPDGKTQVTVEYEGDQPVRITDVVVSTQHSPDVSSDDLHDLVHDHVVKPVLSAIDIHSRGFRLLVNPTGRFVDGGPGADAGLTGRKIIVDTYGGMARHGGGAFSGKDPSKVDRSAAYAMRWVAKNVVAAGFARRCELQVAYAIGKAEPVSLRVETFGTGVVPEAAIRDAVLEVFDLRPGHIIRDLDLLRPIYQPTAAYGAFGYGDRPWESIGRANRLRDVIR